MKNFFALALLTLVSTAAFAGEGFLPGRIESRSEARTILARCLVRDAIKSQNCVGFRFYYSETGREADAKPISDRVFTMEGLEALESKPVVFNAFDGLTSDSDDRLLTVNVVKFLNDSEDYGGESVIGKIAYGAGRGLTYGVAVPVAISLDLVGNVVAAPFTLVQVIAKTIKNGKIRKLIRALESGKKIPMDIGRVYRLRDML
jgi:hypothetical protein